MPRKKADKKPKPKIGRPEALGEKDRGKILGCLSRYGTIPEAADLVKVAHSTVYRLIERDEEFRTEVAQVKAARYVQSVDNLLKAADNGSVKAQIAILERRHKDRWAPVSVQIKMNSQELTDEQRFRLIDGLIEEHNERSANS